jgi:hypothetical protein
VAAAHTTAADARQSDGIFRQRDSRGSAATLADHT